MAVEYRVVDANQKWYVYTHPDKSQQFYFYSETGPGVTVTWGYKIQGEADENDVTVKIPYGNTLLKMVADNWSTLQVQMYEPTWTQHDKDPEYKWKKTDNLYCQGGIGSNDHEEQRTWYLKPGGYIYIRETV